MKSAECLEVGQNLQKKLEETEKEVPGQDDAKIVVRIIIPVVVDVEAVLVEVAHVDVVVAGSLQNLLVLIIFHRKSSFTAFAYMLFFLNFIREHPRTDS